MDVLKAVATRRAVKQYDPDFQIPEADLAQILDAARMGPTAFNLQNWRFVVVTDPALRKQIRAVAWDQAQVTDASVLIVVCADLAAWTKNPARYWQDAPQDVQTLMAGMIDQYYRGREQVQRDEAMRSCGLAAQTLMLTAVSLGYETCPMDGFDFDAVGKLINLPDDHAIGLFVAIGKGSVPPKPRGGSLPRQDVVISNHF